MRTPICDFVGQYTQSGTQRLHMPGHKGKGPLGFEDRDITEIAGADSLYEAQGIIAQSEENASALFGCPTFYATEGASQCIRAMVCLAMLDAAAKGRQVRIAAGRNAHKTFLSAVALLDIPVVWLYPKDSESYLSCTVTAADVDALEDITALYLTSPDYLGNVADIAAISAICRKKGILLLTDNAHGAYLRFLQPSLHPMDLGADLCCDSAHKTLCVLTGGAYLHIRDSRLAQQAKNALALFGSTSPSYLILQSLDAANAELAAGFPQQLAALIPKIAQCKTALQAAGYRFAGNEPMKLTILAKPYGYNGTELAQQLRQQGVECEFADPDYVVLMPAPGTDLDKVEAALFAIAQKAPIPTPAPAFSRPEAVLSVRQAMFRPSRYVAVENALGCILCDASVGCPPAVPILVCGERIDRAALAAFRYYGIESVSVCQEGPSEQDSL